MLANFLEKTKPINSIVLSFLFFAYYFIHLHLSQSIGFIDTSWSLILFELFLNVVFLFLSSFFFEKNGVSNGSLHNTFIMILFYGMFPGAFTAIPFLFVSILFLLIYNNSAQLNSKNSRSMSLFDSGVFAGISFLIYDWSILFLAFIFISTFLAKKTNLNNIIRPILGFITPLILFFTYSFVIENTDIFFSKFNFITNLNFENYSNTSIQAPLIALTTIITLSVFLTLPKVVSVSGPYRYQYALAIVMLTIGSLSIVFASEKNGTELLLAFVPASIVIGWFFKTITHKVLKEIVFIGFVLSSVFFLIKNS